METLNLIYFSPTGTTQKIVKEIGKHLHLQLVSDQNITRVNQPLRLQTIENGVTVIGMPVYAGRLPHVAVEVLKKIKSNNTPAIIVVVYGNREYEDALLELNELVEKVGFNVIAGAAFVAEHSYSTSDKPIAHGRPDKEDLLKCQAFSEMLIDKIKGGIITGKLNIPGNFPYKDGKSLPGTIYPVTDMNNCSVCGECVDVCPTNAISIEDNTVITKGADCIWCCACVKSCPQESRIFDNPTINTIQDRLFTNCQQRKEPEYFI